MFHSKNKAEWAPVAAAENVCRVEEFNIYKNVLQRKFCNERSTDRF